MRSGPISAAIAAALLSAAGCGGGDGSSAETVHLTESQRTGSTVVRPDTPPPCDPAAVTTWAAGVQVTGTTASAVVRVRNDGPVRCEVDIGRSDRLSETAEPDVWLEPGGWADLIAGDARAACDRPSIVTGVQVTVGEAGRTVPVSMIACDWRLLAIYPVERAEVPCDPATLDVVRLDRAVVVRNSGFVACRLGFLVGAEAPGAIDAVAGGDVVAFPIDAVPDGGCESRPATLELSEIGSLAVDGLTDCDAVGGGVPFHQGGDGPLGSLATDDVDAALAALEPFTVR